MGMNKPMKLNIATKDGQVWLANPEGTPILFRFITDARDALSDALAQGYGAMIHHRPEGFAVRIDGVVKGQ